MRNSVLSSFPYTLSRLRDSTHNYFIFGENCNFTYSLEKNIRETQVGRYQLGQDLADTLPINITNRVKDDKRKSHSIAGNE